MKCTRYAVLLILDSHFIRSDIDLRKTLFGEESVLNQEDPGVHCFIKATFSSLKKAIKFFKLQNDEDGLINMLQQTLRRPIIDQRQTTDFKEATNLPGLFLVPMKEEGVGTKNWIIPYKDKSEIEAYSIYQTFDDEHQAHMGYVSLVALKYTDEKQ